MNTYQAIQWFKQTFQNELSSATANTPFTIELLCAIAYQETGSIWSNLINKVSIQQLLLLCVGDTLDFPNRKAFPRNKAALLAQPHGETMFQIARQSLLDMSHHIPSYQPVARNPDKFCHGYGIFQYDLQFFKTDPEYFLQKKWADVNHCFHHCIQELQHAQQRQAWQHKVQLTETELVYVAIAYNKGKASLSKGFKQGYRNADGSYYGENINAYLQIAKSIELPSFTNKPQEGSSSSLYKVSPTIKALNLRRSPVISKLNIITQLMPSQIVTLIQGSMNDDWVKVQFTINSNSMIGYVASKYLEVL